MKMVEIEGVWLNPDCVCIVRKTDHNGLGFQTEVIMESGMQMFRVPPEEVAKALSDKD